MAVEIKDFKINVVEFQNQVIPISHINRIESKEEYDEEAPEGMAYLVIIHLKFPPYMLSFKWYTDVLRDKNKNQLLASLYKAKWKLIDENSKEESEEEVEEELE